MINITTSLDNKELTPGVFLDLSKAYDTIDHHDHEKVLKKLKCYSIKKHP